MILGLPFATFTAIHVIISLIGIASGFIAALAMLGNKRATGWTALFLVTTILTSVTGFMFPFAQILPSHIFGVLSLIVLAVALVALYGLRLSGAWRWIYVVTALVALYLNTFVGVVQAFQKLPFLSPLAPTQSEPPFLIAQLAVLVIFVVLGFVAVKRFHPAMIAPA